MKKIVKLTENDIQRIVKKTIKEQWDDMPGFGRDDSEYISKEEKEKEERQKYEQAVEVAEKYENRADALIKKILEKTSEEMSELSNLSDEVGEHYKDAEDDNDYELEHQLSMAHRYIEDIIHVYDDFLRF